jgi:hypothetical protein
MSPQVERLREGEGRQVKAWLESGLPGRTLRFGITLANARHPLALGEGAERLLRPWRADRNLECDGLHGAWCELPLWQCLIDPELRAALLATDLRDANFPGMVGPVGDALRHVVAGDRSAAARNLRALRASHFTEAHFWLEVAALWGGLLEDRRRCRTALEWSEALAQSRIEAPLHLVRLAEVHALVLGDRHEAIRLLCEAEAKVRNGPLDEAHLLLRQLPMVAEGWLRLEENPARAREVLRFNDPFDRETFPPAVGHDARSAFAWLLLADDELRALACLERSDPQAIDDQPRVLPAGSGDLIPRAFFKAAICADPGFAGRELRNCRAPDEDEEESSSLKPIWFEADMLCQPRTPDARLAFLAQILATDVEPLERLVVIPQLLRCGLPRAEVLPYLDTSVRRGERGEVYVASLVAAEIGELARATEGLRKFATGPMAARDWLEMANRALSELGQADLARRYLRHALRLDLDPICRAEAIQITLKLGDPRLYRRVIEAAR